MSITIKHSRAFLPVVLLRNRWALEVLSDQSVMFTDRKVTYATMFVSRGIYTNINKIRSILPEEEFKTVLEIMRTNCLLANYLSGNKLVKKLNNKYYTVATDSLTHIHRVGSKAVVTDRQLTSEPCDWAEVIVKTNKPDKCRSVHRLGTPFIIRDNIYVLMSSNYEFGISTLLCIKGERIGLAEHLYTAYLNELVPVEIDVQVIENSMQS